MKDCWFIMQLQDTPETWLFKLWPWLEANKIRLAWAGAIIIVAIGVISFNSWNREQKEIAAGQMLTELMLSDSRHVTPEQQAGLFLKIAQDHKNTGAGERAMTQGAALLFDAGQYADAQKQFQQYLDQYPGGFFAAQAALGVAASLAAQGKMDLAAGAYKRVIDNYSDVVATSFAKFSLGQIDERQGKLTEAMNLFQDVAHSNPNSSVGQEAGLHAMELTMKPASTQSATAPAAPFKLSP